MGQGRYICQTCGEKFPTQAIQPNQRDDYHPCPACSSLRVKRAYTRMERLYAVLMVYNRH